MLSVLATVLTTTIAANGAGVAQTALDLSTDIAIAAEHRLVEGVAVGPSGEVFVTSVADRRVIRVDAEGSTIFPLPADLGRPLGIAYDATRDWLWVAVDDVALKDPSPGRASGLIALDRHGRLRARPAPPEEGRAPRIGDVSVHDGRVFASDSASGAVYTCAADCERLETLLPAGALHSAQGSAAFDGGRRLLVLDYGSGPHVVDLARGDHWRVQTDVDLSGLDGLVHVDGWFYAVFNARGPGRVIAFRLGDDHRTVVDLREFAGGPGFSDPTQIVAHDGRLLIVSNSQWATYLPGADEVPQSPTIIVSCALDGAPCLRP